MNRKLSPRNIVIATVLVSFCSCASPTKETRAAEGSPAAVGKLSTGAKIGKGAVTGLRYLVGGPFFLGMTIFGPLGGVPPSAGFEMLQQLHDYDPPYEAPKAKGDVLLRY